MTNKNPHEGNRMDPNDWTAFRAEMHQVLDACVDHLENARNHPWRPVPDGFDAAISLDTPTRGDASSLLTDTIMPASTGNTHPAFFGWVHGTGQAMGLASEMVAAAMNSNCGGRDHGGIRIEKECIRWLTDLAGLGENASGILTTGTSQATIYALSAAKVARFGADVRKTGIQNLPTVRVYIAKGAHSCIKQAMEILGFGGNAVCQITLKDGAMDTDALQTQLTQDAAAGIVPLAIVGTAGSVNTGTYDDLNTLSRIAQEHSTWLHVDAAFGFWIRIAAPRLSVLASGIEHANSIALDGHKWLGVQYDCGACLLRDHDLHRATFSDRAEYLTAQSAGIGAGDWWPTDYGTELSRGMRALKLWTTLKTHDRDTISAAITDNCDQAALMGELVEASPHLTLAHPVISNLCVFTPNAGDASDIAAALQLSGDAVFSTTTVDGKNCLRAAIVNHRTTSQTIHDVIAAVEAQVIAAR